MKTFTATVLVRRVEIRDVEAKNKAEARKKILGLSKDVKTEEQSGNLPNIVDLEVLEIKEGRYF